jgi:hypothetical protein
VIEASAIFLLCWSAILILKSFQLWRLAKDLEAQRSEIRRWKRLSAIRDKTKDKWN